MKIKNEPRKCAARTSDHCVIDFVDGMPYFIQSIIGTNDGQPVCVNCIQSKVVEGHAVNSVKRVMKGESLSEVIGSIFGSKK